MSLQDLYGNWRSLVEGQISIKPADAYAKFPSYINACPLFANHVTGKLLLVYMFYHRKNQGLEEAFWQFLFAITAWTLNK